MKNRELSIMRRLEHPNIVQLKFFFYSVADSDGKSGKSGNVFLNLLMEYVPQQLYRVIRHFAKNGEVIPIIYVKV